MNLSGSDIIFEGGLDVSSLTLTIPEDSSEFSEKTSAVPSTFFLTWLPPSVYRPSRFSVAHLLVMFSQL